MLPQHELVIHLVDVVSREQHDESGSVRLDDVDVLIDGVGRAKIPVRLRDALARRQDIEAFIALGTKEVPAHLEMSDQTVSLVLGRNRDAADSRVNRVGQGKIDDARLPAEIDRRLGAPVGKLQKPASPPAGKNESKGMARKRFVYDGGHLILPGASRLSLEDLLLSGRRVEGHGVDCSGTNGRSESSM